MYITLKSVMKFFVRLTDFNERMKTSGSSDPSSNKAKNLFITTPGGNPTFIPQKSGAGKTKAKMLKPPNAPEKPIVPYIRYSKKVWDKIKTTQSCDLKMWEIGKIIEQMWRDLSKEEKQEYIEEYEAEMVEYEKALKSYHSSQVYQAYILNQNRGKSGMYGLGTEADGHANTSGSPKQVADRRIEVCPGKNKRDDYYSMKCVAQQRYLRNHVLINHIFSDAVVPDVRTVVTTGRLQGLKRQVKFLSSYQRKLDVELQLLEDKYEALHRKFAERTEEFQDELEMLCKPAVDEATFMQMVEEQYKKLKILEKVTQNNTNSAVYQNRVTRKKHEPTYTTPNLHQGCRPHAPLLPRQHLMVPPMHNSQLVGISRCW